MWLELDACGIEIKLRIKGYIPSTKDDWDNQWCPCDFLFLSRDWLNYHKNDDTVLLSCEVEALEESLTKLLANKLSEVKELSFIEPDFIFILHPQSNRISDPRYGIEDIYLEWKVFFWNEGLTDNHLVVTLYRDDIKTMRDYLSQVIKTKQPMINPFVEQFRSVNSAKTTNR